MKWGHPPWTIDVPPSTDPPPDRVDVAVVGGGFSGLAAACWLRRAAPDRSVALLEAGRLGAGASGRTGGLVLDESAAGDLEGLGDVFNAYEAALRELNVDAGFQRTGAWEISRHRGPSDSPITWTDEGTLRVADEIPGGTFNPGFVVSGLSKAARDSGATIHEKARVRALSFGGPVNLELEGGTLRADRVILAVNGAGAGLLPWSSPLLPRFTLAIATAPLSPPQLRSLCTTELKPFYTTDLPYLWGRPLDGNRLIIGGGIVDVSDPAHLAAIDISKGEAGALLDRLEKRVRGLRPELSNLDITHRWGGPVLSRRGSRPLLCRHPESERVVILGSFSGHGNALSIHLARWAADAVLERRELPAWGAGPT